MSDADTTLDLSTGDVLSKVTKLLDDGDDQIAVLRGQLLLEVSLIEVLSVRFPGFEKLAASVDFSKKCRIARAEQLIAESTLQALNALGRLRNEFAHPPLKFKLTDQDERRFLKFTPPHLAPVVQVQLEEIAETSALGKQTRLLIGLLYTLFSATLIQLRENALSTFSETEAPTKDWIRAQLRERQARGE